MTSEQLHKELINLLIKKDWLYHTDSMMKIYSDFSNFKENNISTHIVYSHISNLIYDDKSVMIGFMNDNGMIKYFNQS
jgi:hypothetical protein